MIVQGEIARNLGESEAATATDVELSVFVVQGNSSPDNLGEYFTLHRIDLGNASPM